MAVNTSETECAAAQVGMPSLAQQLGNVQIASRNDLEISRHVFFGETSYVVRDPITFQGHNFSPSDYEIFTSLSEDQALSEVFDDLVKRDVIEADQEESFYQFIVELQKQSLLSLPITDGKSLFQQHEQRQQQRTKNLFMKMLFLKVPLGCPDRFLKNTYHLVRGLFSKAFLVLWLIGLLAAIFLIGSHWSEFTSNLSSVLAINNLPMILVVTCLLKLWHELGHGYACRHYGVAVPNAGLLFMVGTPLAFMDATGSWSLPRRSQRQMINFAGMYFELMIAIVAAFVWVLADNPSVKSIAHFTLLISSVTTIGFNINPLMKYDGYYVLADALGIPNLRSRASFATHSFFRRVFMGVKMPPAESRGLQAILVAYGISASLYRVTLVIAISLMIATQIWIVGMLLGGYYLLSTLSKTFVSVIKYLWTSEEARCRRKLALTYLSILLVGLPAAILTCPLPGRVQARGVAEHATIEVIHAERGGFLRQLKYKDGQQINEGAVLCVVEDNQSNAKRLKQRAQLASLQMKYRHVLDTDRVDSAKTEQQIEQLEYELSFARSNSPLQTITAPASGLVVSKTRDLSVGQYLEPGTELLKIGNQSWVVNAVANASSVADIQPEIGQTVHCRFSSHPDSTFAGTIKTISASGSRIVQHKALTHLAGGFIPVQPDTLEATEPFFEMTIELEEQPLLGELKNGLVCEIRFTQTHQTLADYLYRAFIRLQNQVNLK